MSGKRLLVERGSERLAERRRLRRRRVCVAFVILLLLLLATAVWGLWQSQLRISHVQIFGLPPDRQAQAAEYVTQAMQGSYGNAIPRDSILFFSATRIRNDLLAAHPEIAAVSIFRKGLTGLSIKIDTRVPVARWCGLAPTKGVEEYCYFFDAKGYIFAAAATTTQTINPFMVYAPLVGETLEPLRATMVNADKLPSAFDFARQLATFGSPVERIIFRGEEVDDLLVSGARVTYLLGDEQNAFTALVSARENFNLADGSIDYVDLRFGSKVYVKKKSGI
ncbi:MAG: hypothetical protein WC798_02530 [Candidatus Paceibacterota bacterium]|jgi:hypothetical protein